MDFLSPQMTNREGRTDFMLQYTTHHDFKWPQHSHREGELEKTENKKSENNLHACCLRTCGEDGASCENLAKINNYNNKPGKDC